MFSPSSRGFCCLGGEFPSARRVEPTRQGFTPTEPGAKLGIFRPFETVISLRVNFNVPSSSRTPRRLLSSSILSKSHFGFPPPTPSHDHMSPRGKTRWSLGFVLFLLDSGQGCCGGLSALYFNETCPRLIFFFPFLSWSKFVVDDTLGQAPYTFCLSQARVSGMEPAVRDIENCLEKEGLPWAVWKYFGLVGLGWVELYVLSAWDLVSGGSSLICTTRGKWDFSHEDSYWQESKREEDQD
jgi:hypothetical protein